MLIEHGSPTNPKLVIVDDERAVVESLADLLRKEFHVWGTDDVQEALRLLKSQDVALVLTDQRMPGLTGAELLAQATEISPDTVRVLFTAYSDIQAVIQAVNEGQLSYYFTKPWNVQDLLELVRGGVRHYLLVAQRHRLVARLAEANRAYGDPPAEAPEGTGSLAREGAEIATLQTSLHQLQTAFDDLRKLNEVIPICMKCAKMKTSDARWENVVEYLKRNSTFLSHGYCPQCTASLMTEWNLTPAKE